MTARKPFIKSIPLIPIEEAHGGSGKRQLILSKEDPISSQLEAMTKGFLAAGAVFDWHDHDGVDEFFLVLKGTGCIEYKDGSKFEYKPEDLIYSPSNLLHKIENTGTTDSEFFFIRLKD